MDLGNFYTNTHYLSMIRENCDGVVDRQQAMGVVNIHVDAILTRRDNVPCSKVFTTMTTGYGCG